MKTCKIVLLLFGLGLGTALSAQNFKIDPNKSEIKWDARKINGSGHYGTVAIADGSLEIENSKIKSATINANMASLTNTDGKDGAANSRLVGHLKSDDFFNVEEHPSAKFVLTGSGEFDNGTAKVYGRLTIKDITHPINFVAKKEGNTMTTSLAVDRTKYDVKYGSGKFFSDLGDRAIKDEFTLEIKLVLIAQ